MNRFVPHEVDYDSVKQVDGLASILLWASAALSLFTLAVDEGGFIKSKELLQNTLNSILSALAVLYFVLDIFQNYLFQLAEANRKNDFIDNSLNTRLADNNSREYFTNETISPGVYKLGVNCFENSLFTKTISGKMIRPMVIKSLVILTLYLLIALFTEQKTFATLLQIALPFTIMQQTLRLTVFHFRIKTVYSNFKRIFTSAGIVQTEALLIDNTISYEKTLSWGGILLDSKLFKKMNPDLSEEWKRTKTAHNIPS